MRDIETPVLIKLKAVLFLVAGTLACGLLWLDRPTVKVAFLLATAIWCFCRAYYFAFYVVENYLDASYKFSGLLSLIRYLLSENPPQANNRRTR